MSYDNFVEDLQDALDYEYKVRLKLEAQGLVFKESITDSTGDLLMTTKDGKELMFEVKTDYVCAKSRMLPIEFKCRGKLSGISITESDYWVTVIIHPDGEEEYWYAKVKLIRKLIRLKMYAKEIKAGDDNASEMFMFDFSLWKKIGKELK